MLLKEMNYYGKLKSEKVTGISFSSQTSYKMYMYFHSKNVMQVCAIQVAPRHMPPYCLSGNNSFTGHTSTYIYVRKQSSC